MKSLMTIICMLLTFYTVSASTRNSDIRVDIAAPGTEITHEVKCRAVIHSRQPPWTLVTVDFDGPLKHNDEVIWDLISFTEIGRTLEKRLRPKIKSGELKVLKLTKALEDEGKKYLSIGMPVGLYIHDEKTIYLNLSVNTGVLLSVFIHELKHVQDHEDRPINVFSKEDTLASEYSAHSAEDQFVTELSTVFPCLKKQFFDYPQNYTQEDIKKVYRHLR